MTISLSTIPNSMTIRFLAPHVWTLVMLLQATNPGHGNDITPEEFLTKAPQAWQQYKTLAETLSGTIRYRRMAGNKLDAYSVQEYKSSGANRLMRSQSTSSKKPLEDVSGKPLQEQVYGRNRAYSFHLRRDRAENAWVLVDLNIPRRGSKSALDAAFDDLARHTREAICLGWYDLLDLVEQPTFRVVKIGRTQVNGETLLEVVFDNPHKAEQKAGQRFCPIQSGTLVLDPARQWCLRSYRALMLGSDAESVMTGELEYDFSKATHPIPKRCKKRQVIQGWQIANVPDYIPTEITTEIEYDLYPNRTWPDEEFTLTAFGLPEPPDVDWRPPTPLYVWVMLAAVVLLTAAGVFAWLKQRAKRARSSPA